MHCNKKIDRLKKTILFLIIFNYYGKEFWNFSFTFSKISRTSNISPTDFLDVFS